MRPPAKAVRVVYVDMAFGAWRCGTKSATPASRGCSPGFIGWTGSQEAARSSQDQARCAMRGIASSTGRSRHRSMASCRAAGRCDANRQRGAVSQAGQGRAGRHQAPWDQQQRGNAAQLSRRARGQISGLYPLLGGTGRLRPRNRPALEQALGLDASICSWTVFPTRRCHSDGRTHRSSRTVRPGRSAARWRSPRPPRQRALWRRRRRGLSMRLRWCFVTAGLICGSMRWCRPAKACG